MSTDELRKHLVARITRSRRPEPLREAYRLMGTDTDDFERYKLSPEQRASISKGLKDVEIGKVIQAREADNAIDAWLSE